VLNIRGRSYRLQDLETMLKREHTGGPRAAVGLRSVYGLPPPHRARPRTLPLPVPAPVESNKPPTLSACIAS